MSTNLPSTSILFHEEQQFRQPWVWALLMLISAVVFVVIITAHSFWLALLILLLDVAIIGFMYSLKLTTQVRPDAIYIRFFPLVRQTIPLDEISEYHARRYRPILDYGGWGIRYGWKGKAYNVRGNQGVQLVLSYGKRLLIGSQQAEALAGAITRAKNG